MLCSASESKIIECDRIVISVQLHWVINKIAFLKLAYCHPLMSFALADRWQKSRTGSSNVYIVPSAFIGRWFIGSQLPM